jgi:ribosome-associated translation inhibitor RaiA
VWKTTIHSHAVEVDSRLRLSIEQQMRHTLDGVGQRIAHVHVRLYGETGGGLRTCYIRVDVLPSGGVAVGETAGDLMAAVAGAVARIGVAVRRELERRQPAGQAPAASGYRFLR